MSAEIVTLSGRKANAAEFNDGLETAALNRLTEGGMQILALERTGRGSGKCLRLLTDLSSRTSTTTGNDGGGAAGGAGRARHCRPQEYDASAARSPTDCGAT